MLNPSSLAALVGQNDPSLGDLVRRSAKAVQLHMDVSHDVGLVADVQPQDAQTADELRRAGQRALAGAGEGPS